MAELRLPGRETSNPLVVQNEHLASITADVRRIADAMVMSHHNHVYALAQAKLPQHGGVWGAYCVACSDQHSEYVYPCLLRPDEPIKPPPWFTVGKAFVRRDDGSFLVYEDGLPLP